MSEITTKKWYQSKLVAIGGVLVLVFGSNALLHWLTGPVNVSVEQIEAIEQVHPAVLDIIDRLKAGESILNVIGVSAGVLIAIVRTFFTGSLIPQSLRK